MAGGSPPGDTSNGGGIFLPDHFPDEQCRAAARLAFGAQLGRAWRYAELLAGSGVERGLIGPREAERLWERHLLNSVAGSSLIPRDARVVDLGSGAGLPGLPLALARPDISVSLVESRKRPTDFLFECVESLELSSVVVLRARAEELVGRVLADVVVARAVSSLTRLAQWALPLLDAGGELLAWKGAGAEDELRESLPRLRALGGDTAEVVRIGEEGDFLGATLVRVVASKASGKRRAASSSRRDGRRGDRR